MNLSAAFVHWQQPPEGFTLDCLVGRCALRGAENDSQRFPPVIQAILCYDQEALREALDADSSAATSVEPSSGITPLVYAIIQGFQEGVNMLLDVADVHQVSGFDKKHRVAGRAIYTTGHATALHACAEHADVNITRAVLDASHRNGNVSHFKAALDADGHDAVTLARLLGRPARMLELLEHDGEAIRPGQITAWSADYRQQRLRQWMLQQRRRIDAALHHADDTRTDSSEHLFE